jgi:hypothetical protein
MKKLVFILLCLPMIGFGQIDKIVYKNESKANPSSLPDAIYVLRKAPLLRVDVGGNVSLRGSRNIEWKVNGDAIILSPSTGNIMHVNFLCILTIPVNEIKKVEIITDPRRKYDGEGYVGVVNIITRKKRWFSSEREKDVLYAEAKKADELAKKADVLAKKADAEAKTAAKKKARIAINKAKKEKEKETLTYEIVKRPKQPSELVVSDIKFSDPNNNNTIEADEQVILVFNLKNNGKGEAQNIKIQIEDLNNILGLDYKRTYQFSSLESGENKKIKIPITASLNIETGESNFEINILEGNGFNAEPFNFVIATQSFISPKLEIVDFQFLSNEGQIKVGKVAKLQFAIQNIGQGIAKDIYVNLNLPKNVFASDEEEFYLKKLNPGEIKQFDFEFFTNKRYNATLIEIIAKVSEEHSKYGSTKKMTEQIGKDISTAISFNPKSKAITNKIDIERFSLTSKVDKDIPINIKVKNRFALVIGNEDYASYQSGLQNEQNVDYAERDAAIFKQYCLNTFGVKSENMFSITNATSGMMSQEIKKVIKLTELEGNNAELIIYYAGHGFPDDQKVPHLIPVDVSGGDLSRAINLQELYKDLGNLKAKKVTVFLDACFTGGGRESGLMASRGVKVKPKEGSLGGSLVVFSASSGDQSSLPFNKEKHGAFTYHLLKALQDAEGDISYGNLYDAINIEVNKTTLRNQGMEQTPKVNTSEKVINDWRNWKF